MRYYNGKKPCAGCGMTGEEKHRFGADSLCEDCKQLIRLGKTVKKESTNFSLVALPRYTIQKFMLKKVEDESCTKKVKKPYYIPSYSDQLSKAVEGLIRTLDEGEKPNYEYRLWMEDSWDSIYVKTETALAYFKMLEALSTYSNELRNNSFMEGKNLLMGLNKGTMTLKDFEERK